MAHTDARITITEQQLTIAQRTPQRAAATSRLRHLPIVLCTACALSVAAFAQADEFDAMRSHWVSRLTGGASGVNGSAASLDDGAATRTAANQHAARLLQTLDLRPESNALWPDAADWNNPNALFASATIVENFKRIETMALAYATPGSKWTGNHDLQQAILYALDWMNRKHYNSHTAAYGNWWSWQIGAPLHLLNTLTLVTADLPPDLLARYLAAVDHFDPSPAWRTSPQGKLSKAPETGANLLDKSLAVALRGVLGKSPERVAAAHDALSGALMIVHKDDGFYADGSFIQHHDVAYSGSYGVVLLQDFGRLLYLYANSPWPIRDSNVKNVYSWVRNGFIPLMVDGAMIDNVRGRKIAVHAQSGRDVGWQIAAAIADLAQIAPPGDAPYFREAVKGWIARSPDFSKATASLPTYESSLLAEIAADNSIAAAPERPGVRIYSSMDRVIQRGPGYAAALSMFSDRITAFESGNGQNLSGWWTGAGMLDIYDSDHDQYESGYWATVDFKRLPGTTTDHSGSSSPVPWRFYANTKDWVGGAHLDGRIAAVGMDFDLSGVTGTNLSGKKSWFFLGDKIVATGSGISGASDSGIETIVDNRKLDDKGDNALVVDGAQQSADAGWHVTLANVSWVHLQGNRPGSEIGYVFPQQASLYALLEHRSGNWKTNDQDSSDDPASNNFLSLAIEHGEHADNQGYAYVMLPEWSATSTQAFAAKPTIEVLENTVEASAVADRSLGVVGANIWKDGGKTVQKDGHPYLTCDSEAAIVVEERDGRLAIAVADPTQHHTGDMTIEVYRKADTALQVPTGVTILQLNPSIRLKMKMEGLEGGTLTASFAAAAN